jgi:hypothetical protein
MGTTPSYLYTETGEIVGGGSSIEVAEYKLNELEAAQSPAP